MNNFDVLLGMKLGGGGGSSTLVSKTITANGTYNPADDNADGYSSVTANVPNTYDLADEGKVVSSGALVAQSSRNIDANGLYDTTLNNSVSVDVPNTYTAGDEGKVVSSGALVSQTAYPSTITANNTYDTTLYNSVTVNVPPTPAEPVAKKDVNFYDYDGTVVQAYSKTDFLALTELPANPTHTGLTAQGWNWSLADAKSYVTDYGKLDIGQMYITDDGKTRLYIHLEEGRLSPVSSLQAFSNTSGTIDWGDGTTPVNFTIASYSIANLSHTYAQSGDYVIGIAVNSGRIELTTDARSCILWGKGKADVAYKNSIRKIEIGSNVRIYSSAFSNYYSLSSVTIPNTVTSIGQQAFLGCYSLSSVTIPNTVTSIGNSAFWYCYGLSSVNVPRGITSINIGIFQDCRTLSSVTTPSSVTSISNDAFYYCYSLLSVTIPNTVTGIGNRAFYYCYSLTSVTIPSSVTGIGISAFDNCSSLGYIKFEGSTPPTVANANAWAYLPTDCTIYVPTGSLSAYTSASNYPDPNTYTYVEY